MRWDPEQYLQFAAERGRPFHDLLARVGAERPGAASSTWAAVRATSPGTWPPAGRSARVEGIDSSPEMIAQAVAAGPDPRVTFAVGDLRDWQPAEQVDVLVSNATLQWVPGHLDLLPRLVDAVRPGGWLAFQVPANSADPSHTAMTELATSTRWAAAFEGRDRARRRWRSRRPTSRCWPGWAAPSTPGRPPTCTCSPATTRSCAGPAAPGSGRTCRRCRRRGARGVPGRVPRAGRPRLPAAAVGHRPAVPPGLRGGPGRARCGMTGQPGWWGCTTCSSPRRAAPRRCCARFYGDVLGHDRGAEAAGPRRPRRRVVPGRRARAAPGRRGRLPPGRQGAPRSAGGGPPGVRRAAGGPRRTGGVGRRVPGLPALLPAATRTATGSSCSSRCRPESRSGRAAVDRAAQLGLRPRGRPGRSRRGSPGARPPPPSPACGRPATTARSAPPCRPASGRTAAPASGRSRAP